MKRPGFTIVAALTLALGIGANSAIFSVVNAVLLRPLPFPHSEGLVLIWETSANRELERGAAAPSDFLDWRDQTQVFDELSVWRSWTQTVRGDEGPEQLLAVQVSPDFFRMFGVKPILGRGFQPEEEIPGHEQVVMMSERLWRRQFGAAPGVVGRSIEVSDKPYAVVGIVPAGFSPVGLSHEYDLWMPLAIEHGHADREDHSLIVIGRLKPNISIRKADAAMKALFESLKRQGNDADPQDSVSVVSLRDDLIHGFGSQLRILLAAVGCVLLIACANVANLLLARAATREKEIAVRSAMGAGRLRVVRQLLTESILLALVGGGLGVFAAYGGIQILRAVLPAPGSTGEIPYTSSLRLDGTVLGFTLAISILTGIVFGLVPAIQVSRPTVSETLKEAGRGSAGGRRGQILRAGLVVSELSISLVLLVGAGLLIRSFWNLMNQDLGLQPQGVVTMEVWLPESRYADGSGVANFYQQALERVAALPGVQSSSAANFIPLSGWRDFCDFDIEGRAAPPRGEEFTSQYTVIDSNFLRTMKIPVKAGRDLTPADGAEAPGVVLINEALAQRYWPHEDPLGKRIRVHLQESKAPWRPEPRTAMLTIVGIVGDVREWTIGDKKPAEIYLPYLQNPSRLMRLTLRSSDTASTVSAVRAVILSIDKNQPVSDVRTMDEYLAANFSQRRIGLMLLALFAALATILAAVGIYGVMAYAVAHQSHEIGIRMALGAQRRDVLSLVLGQCLRLISFGVALGGAVNLIAMRYLASELYGVRVYDPLTLTGVILLLVFVALVAGYVPALRATRVDPNVALRYE